MKKQMSRIIIAVIALILTALPLHAESRCLSFDGVDDYVNMGYMLDGDVPSSNITLEAWISPSSFGDDYWDNSIIDKHGSSSGYALRCGGNGVLSFNLGDGSNWHEVISPEGALVTGEWQHVAGVYDGSTMRIYVNGVSVNSLAPVNFNIASSSSYIHVGGSQNYPDRKFHGRIDEVRLWDVPRDINEIPANMHKLLDGTQTGFMYYFKLDKYDASYPYLYETVHNMLYGSIDIVGAEKVSPGAPVVDGDFVKGHITTNTTWSGDIDVVGDVIVDNGVTLTIDPGTTVKFLEYYYLDVQGRLLAEGTESDSIRFTTNYPDRGWRGIRFINTPTSNATSKISYSVVEHKRHYDEGAIHLSNYSNVEISHNRIFSNNGSKGGGISCYNYSSPIITDNEISYNGSSYGGGIHCSNHSSPTISNNIISNNSVWIGGAIYCTSSSIPLISNNIISNNSANSDGGAIYCKDTESTLTIEYNKITNNTSARFGGGVYTSSNVAIRLRSNLISDNNAAEGAGLYVVANASLYENTIINNTASSTGGGIIYQSTHSDWLQNSIIYGNSAPSGAQIYLYDSEIHINHCDIQGGLGEIYLDIYSSIDSYDENLDIDPRFNDPSNDDYSLDEFSPCINGGTPGAISGFDLAGNNRQFHSSSSINSTIDEMLDRVDIGAYEYSSESGVIPTDYIFTEDTEINTFLTIPNGITLTVNPNVTLSLGQDIELNILGSLIAQATPASKIKFTAINTTNGWGGFHFMSSSSSSNSVFESCIIEYGKKLDGQYGGNIDVYNYDPLRIENSYITNGFANAHGGGISCIGSDIEIIGCVLSDNATNSDGGAIRLFESSPLFVNLTITNNSANSGGAISFSNSAGTKIRNSILWGNNGLTEIDGTIDNNNITYSAIEGGYQGDGNIEEDPVFFGSGEDFYQAKNSYCLNACTDISELPSIDILGNPRIFSQPGYSKVDMGAYEYQGLASPINLQASDGSNDYNGFVNISWDFNSSYRPLDGFKIFRSGSAEPIGAVSNSQFFFHDDTAIPGTVYSYYAQSYSGGSSADSNEDSGYLKPNGIITGTVKTSNNNPVQGVKLSLNPSPGYCLEFDGTTNLIITDPEVSFDNDFTIETWVKTDQTDVSILKRGILDLKINSSGNVELTDGINTFIQSDNSILANDSTWHHISIARTYSNNTIVMYLDSLEVGSQSSFSLQSGITGNITTDTGFVGFLDDIRVWSVARDSVQIVDGRKIIISTEEAGLKGYWPLNEGTGSVAFDATNYAHNADLNDTMWSDTEPGVLLGAFTNDWGQYRITQISYGIVTTFDVIPSKPGHNFQPEQKQVTLSESNIAQDGVDFTDNSLIPISGTIKYQDTECPVEDVSILINGELPIPPIYTDETGYYVLEVEHGTECVISASYQNHSFNRSWDLGAVTVPQSSKNFDDITKDRFRLEVVGGVDHWPIGSFDVVLNSVNGYVTKEISAGDNSWNSGGIMVDNIPPIAYNVTVDPLYGSDPFGLEENEYFQSIKTDTVSFDFDILTIDTLRFVWKNELEASVTWPEMITVASDSLPGDTIYYVETHHFDEYPDAEFYVLPQNEWVEIEVKAFEDYNFDGFTDHFSYIDDCDINITDEVGTSGLIETEFGGSEVYTHRFAPYTPNILSGTERQYQNMMEVKVFDDLNRNAVVTDYVLIEGIKPLEDTYATTTPEIPILVLHDPPGDGSSATFNQTSSHSFTWSTAVCTNNETNKYANVHLGPDFSIGAGVIVSVELETDVTIDLSYGFTSESSQSNNFEHSQTWTTTEEYSTSDDDQVIGGGSDMFVGGAMNLIYGITMQVEWDADSNKVDLKKGVMVNPDGFATTYIYTANQISNTVIPNLIMIGDSLSADLWQTYLDNNEENKLNAELDRNISFNSGAAYSYSEEYESTSSNTIEFETTVSNEFGAELGITVAGVGGEVGYTFRSSMTIGSSSSSETSQTTTTSYSLADDDETSELNELADYFSVDVKTDPVYGTPVFDLVAGASSCPWEENTLPREGVAFTANTYSAYNLLQDETAAFILNLGNTSQSNNGDGEDRRYYFSVNQGTNSGGATIKINGVAIEGNMPFDIPGGEMLQAIMTVEQGPIAYEYEDIEIRFGSDYDDGAMDSTNTHFFSQEKLFTITWETPYSKVKIAEPAEDWTANQANDDILDIKFNNYNIGIENFKSIKLEYKQPDGDIWFPAFEIPIDSTFIADHPLYMVQPWDISSIPDGDYEIRSLATDSVLTPYYTEVVTGTIDRSSPELLGAPEPADGILEPNDVISISFVELLDPLTINTDSVSVKVVRTDMSVDVDVDCFENTVTLTSRIANFWLENEIVEVTISGVKDLNGNPMESAETWDFYVNRNPVNWSETHLEVIKPIDGSMTLTAELDNTGGDYYSFVITDYPDSNYYAGLQHHCPSWLTVTPASEQLIPLANQEIQFQISDQIGFGHYETTLYAHTSMGNEEILIEVDVLSDPPAWSLTEFTDFESSMSVIGELNIESTISIDPNDIIGAFIQDENGEWICHGVANVEYAPIGDHPYQVFLTIYNNFSSPAKVKATDEISFRIWDNSENKEYYQIDHSVFGGTLTYMADAIHGTPMSPIDLATITAMIQEISLSTGWTWFSTNLALVPSTINDVLAPISAIDDDFVKSQNSFAQYYSGSWLGSLTDLNNASMYKIKLSEAQDLEIMGDLKNPAITTIPYNSGWNWIGYIPHVSMGVNQAMANRTNVSGDFIKNQFGYAFYVDADTGWIGSLKFMNPGEGFMLYAASGGSFQYPEYNSKSSGDFPAYELTVLKAAPDWSVNVESYEYTASLTIELLNDSILTTTGNYMVGAFVGEECRGSITSTAVSDTWLYFLTVHSNTQNEEISLKIYDADGGEILDPAHSFVFMNDLILGSPSDPYQVDIFGTLDAPQNIVTAINGSNLELTWDVVERATGYDIYSSDDPYGTFTLATTVGTNLYTVPTDQAKFFYYVIATTGVKVETKVIVETPINRVSK